MKQKWTKFSKEHPKEAGVYWIFQKFEKGGSIDLFDYDPKYGWNVGLHHDIPEFWTHWMIVSTPAPPKD